jgi:gamma-glutamylputrescine oxidase
MSVFHDAPSYWQATAPAPVMSTDLPATAQIVVVGGGFFGAATAYFLARAGAAPLVIEQVAPAYGATGRNGGFHVVGTAEGYADAVVRLGRDTARAVMQITLDSRALLRQVIAEEQIACDYRETGHLSLALGDAQYADLRRHVAALHADGFAAELLDRHQTQELIDTPLSDEITGALYGADNALLHSARLVYGLIAAAQRHGAHVAIARVERLASQHGCVRVMTNRGVLEAGSVVVTVNAWTRDLIPALHETMMPVRGQALAYAPIRRVFRAGVGAAVTPTGEYWHQTPEGAIVIGGCRACAPGRDVGVTEMVPTPSGDGGNRTDPAAPVSAPRGSDGCPALGGVDGIHRRLCADRRRSAGDARGVGGRRVLWTRDAVRDALRAVAGGSGAYRRDAVGADAVPPGAPDTATTASSAMTNT